MQGKGNRTRLIPEDHPDLQTETVEILLGKPAPLGGLIHPRAEIRREMHRDRRPRGGLLDPLCVPRSVGGGGLLLLGRGHRTGNFPQSRKNYQENALTCLATNTRHWLCNDLFQTVPRAPSRQKVGKGNTHPSACPSPRRRPRPCRRCRRQPDCPGKSSPLRRSDGGWLFWHRDEEPLLKPERPMRTLEITESGSCNESSCLCCCCCVRAVEKLIRAEIEIETIGRRGRVRFGWDTASGFYCLPLGGKGRRHPITRDQIAAVCARYAFLKELDRKNPTKRPRHRANGQYNQPKWKAPGANGMIVCPFIAALVELLDQLGVI